MSQQLTTPEQIKVSSGEFVVICAICSQSDIPNDVDIHDFLDEQLSRYLLNHNLVGVDDIHYGSESYADENYLEFARILAIPAHYFYGIPDDEFSRDALTDEITQLRETIEEKTAEIKRLRKYLRQARTAFKRISKPYLTKERNERIRLANAQLTAASA